MNTLPASMLRTWLKRLLWLTIVLLIPIAVFLYYYGPWLAYHLGTGALGGATVMETDASCGSGEYRIVVYKYQSGDGYLELMNRDGKVFDSARYAKDIEYGPFIWKPDCKKVRVGANEGLRYLEVK